MPMCKWQIEPINLVSYCEPKSAGRVPKDFTELSNEICCNIIRQLSCLSEHAQDLFRELNLQASEIWTRSERLKCKVSALKERSKFLNPTADQVSLDDIILCKPFKSGLNKQTIGIGRPEAIAEAYSKIEQMPEINRLNQFKSLGEKDCCKLYSDPNFFFESWCGQIKQEVEKKPARKKAPAKKKAEVTRKPQNLNLSRIQDRMKDEIGWVSKATTEPGRNSHHHHHQQQQQQQKEPIGERLSQVSSNSKTSLSSAQEKSKDKCDGDSIQTTQASPPPALSERGDDAESGFDPEDFSLPPPPDIPVPSSDDQKRGTLYMIEDFDPDFLIIPAPPPLTSLAIVHQLQNAPALPVPPPPPPSFPPGLPQVERKTSTEAPRTFASMINDNAFKLKSVASNPGRGNQVDRQQSSSKGDSRDELLSAIRNGIKLRKVDEVGQETKAQVQSGVAGMFDVQMIMEMRRRALQDDDDEDDDGECYWDE